MKSYLPFQFGGDRRAYLREKKRWRDLYQLSHTPTPAPPSPIPAAPLTGAVQLSWEPTVTKNVARWRVTMDNESNVVLETSSPAQLRAAIAVADSNNHTFFISGISAGGKESTRISVQGKSL